MQSAKRKVQSVGTALQLWMLPISCVVGGDDPSAPQVLLSLVSGCRVVRPYITTHLVYLKLSRQIQIYLLYIIYHKNKVRSTVL